MTHVLRIFCWVAGLYTFLTLSLPTFSSASTLGRELVNTATIEYRQNGNHVILSTGPASFVVEARRTPSKIEFFRIAVNATDGVDTALNGSDYSPSGSLDGPYLEIGASDDLFAKYVKPGTNFLNKAGTVTARLIPAKSYTAGELVIVSVTDAGQNGNPELIETIAAEVEVSEGDQIVVLLYESEPDSGMFYAYIPSSSEATQNYDAELTLAESKEIAANYVDQFDITESSSTTALLDTSGQVIESISGEAVDGVTVALINSDTNELAEVFGPTGNSSYPAIVVSGEAVTDSLGITYTPEMGEFNFPLVSPGKYHFKVTAQDDYNFPSLVTDFSAVDVESSTITSASYGETFEVTETSPVAFTLPIDSSSYLVLQKETNTSLAAIGDFIPYTLTVENRGEYATPIKIRDIAPHGFRLKPSSVTVSQGTISVDTQDGSNYDFLASPLAVSEAVTITYVMEVGAGAQNGDALNTAYLINSLDEKISNAAESTVYIQEDLLRSKGTIVGLVREAQCDVGPSSKEEIVGVPGIRIYMETGGYVVSDERGQFHFENIDSGTHVVQMDSVSFPAGYKAETCAGIPVDKSKFVDLSGGTIWRADFVLRKTSDTSSNIVTDASGSNKPDYLNFDKVWLDEQSSDFDWSYPNLAQGPGSSSIHMGVKHKSEYMAKVYLNGNVVAVQNSSGRLLSSDRTVTLSRWRSVDLQKGENIFDINLIDANGKTVETLQKTVWYVSNVLRAAYVPEASHLKADGKTSPTIALKIMDGAGRRVHSGRVVSVDVEAPYTIKLVSALERQTGTTEGSGGNGGVVIGQDGLAKVVLEPTLTTGYVTVNVRMDDDRVEVIRAYLAPQARDWLVVGMAEGRAGSRSAKSGVETSPFDDIFGNGRIAVYAKGTVLKDWLLTIGVDTDRTRDDASESGFVQEINPNSGYLIYGDRSYQQIDAQSRYPFYARLEKEGVQALFGDFQTDLTTTQLSRYSRRLSGLKFIADKEKLSINLFASETNQGFNKDELAADGTSGPYQLSAFPILEQSETITIEVRDRVRPDEVIETRTMIRYFDYELSSQTGELIFREPVNVTDSDLNSQVIVVDYETTIDAERNLTYGGRGAVKLNDGRTIIGASLISESGSTTGANAKSTLYGVDASFEPTENIRLKAEYAETKTEGDEADTKGRALLVEGDYQSSKASVSAYFREENTGFGLGQQTSATENIRRYGLRATRQLNQRDDAETQRRSTIQVEGEGYRESNLTTGQSRDIVEAMVTRRGESLNLDGGLQYVKEVVSDGSARESILMIASARKAFKAQGITVFSRHEQPLGSDESSTFPQRTVLGADKTLTDRVTLNLRHEILGGDNASGQNTTFGASVRPWVGGDIRTAFDHATSDGSRLGATIGVDQNIFINNIWSASLGGARRSYINDNEDVIAIVEDDADNPLDAAPVSTLTGTDQYTSLYSGLQRTTELMTVSGRVEMRNSTTEDRYTATLAAARQIKTDLSFAAAARFQDLNRKDLGAGSNLGNVSFGMAYRPRENAPVLFDRLDFKFEKSLDGTKTQKLVNNIAVNADLFDKIQTSLFLGTKFSQATIDEQTYESWTHLVGGEQRYQINKLFDVGMKASVMHSPKLGTTEYSIGPNVGVSPNKDIWISAGWNISGFSDDDFEAARYSRQGPYLTMRLKFDQDSTRGLLKRLTR